MEKKYFKNSLKIITGVISGLLIFFGGIFFLGAENFVYYGFFGILPLGVICDFVYSKYKKKKIKLFEKILFVLSVLILFMQLMAFVT